MWLQIIERELRLASKRRALYLLRPVAPLLLLIFMVLPFLLYSLFRGQEGRNCFVALGTGIFVVAIFAGVAFSADCISNERRQGTLPLLQLAGLKSLDLFLGKLPGAGIPAFFALVSMFPLLAIPLLLGGVEGIDVAKLIFVLLSTLFLGLAAGLWGSVRSTDQADSLRKAVFLVFLLLIGGSAMASTLLLCSRKIRMRRISSVVVALADVALLAGAGLFFRSFGYLPGSPLYDLIHILSGPKPGTDPAAFWLSAGMSFGAVLLVFGSAAASDVSVESEPLQSTTRGRAAKSYRYFSDPLKWLVLRESGSRSALGWAVGAVVFTRLFQAFPSFFGFFRWNLWILFWIPSIAMTFLLARISASFIAQGRETGTLEILLTTPLTWPEIIRAQRRIYFETIRLPVCALIVLDLLFYTQISSFGASSDPVAALLYVCSSVASTILFFISIFWMSLYFSLKSNSALHAAAKAALWVTILPMLGSYVVPLLLRNFSFFGLAPYAVMTFIFRSLHIGIYAAMILWAKKRAVPRDQPQGQRGKASFSWVQLPWERVRRVGEDIL